MGMIKYGPMNFQASIFYLMRSKIQVKSKRILPLSTARLVSRRSKTLSELHWPPIESKSRLSHDVQVHHKTTIGIRKTKVNIWSEEYSIGPQKSVNLLIKVVIKGSHLDTNGKTSQIRIQFIPLDDFMLTCGHDISKFNGNDKVLLNLFKARVETKNDLLTNIFKGYTACSNKVFVKCITHKQKRYIEGADILQDNPDAPSGAEYQTTKDNQ